MATAGAVVMPAPCAGVYPCDPEQAVSTPSTATPANAVAHQLRFNLFGIRFMIINLAIGCEARPLSQLKTPGRSRATVNVVDDRRELSRFRHHRHMARRQHSVFHRNTEIGRHSGHAETSGLSASPTFVMTPGV
jgi:hypothetical protein